ncbi:MAG: amidohydrolase family protein [Phycisphaeraceae bacterium]
MIVDLHTHIWESPEQLGRGAAARMLRSATQPWDRPDASTTAHDAAMEPVQHAVILGFESSYLGASISAEQIARYVARRPEKYLGFAGLDPLAGNALKQVARVRSLGLSGVTISPAGQAFHPAHTQAMKLYEQCVAQDLPVLVQSVTHLSSEAKLEFAQPYLFDEVAREFPDLRLIISQVGHPWIDQALVLIGKHRNVYADISSIVSRPWPLYNLLQSAHHQGVMDRLLFGSDFPFCTPQRAITTIYSVNTLTQGTMLPSVPREQLRLIVERDVLSLLGMKPAVKAALPAPAKAPIQVAAPAPAAAPIASPATISKSNGSVPNEAPAAPVAAPAPAASKVEPVSPVSPEAGTEGGESPADTDVKKDEPAVSLPDATTAAPSASTSEPDKPSQKRMDP